jgi:indole-3-glycerol phosphate synthase
VRRAYGVFARANSRGKFQGRTTNYSLNNRDVRTLHTDLEHTIRRRQLDPADRLVVGESGIRTRQGVERLGAAGVRAMLVGETLMARPEIGAAVDELLGSGRS